METKVTTNSNYNFCELIRDVINGPNGQLIIGCGTIISLALISQGFNLKINQLSLSTSSTFN